MNSSLFWTTKKMTALKTLFFGGWRGGSTVKKGKGKRGGKGGWEEQRREECNRQTAQGQRVGIITKKKKKLQPCTPVSSWKKKMKSMLAEGISPVTPNTTEEKIENFEVQAFLICWQSWLRKSRKVERNIKINPKKGSGNKIKSKLHVSMLTTNYTKTNSKAFGIN